MRGKPAAWCLAAVGGVLLGTNPVAGKPAVVYNIDRAEALASRTGRPILAIAGNKG